MTIGPAVCMVLAYKTGDAQNPCALMASRCVSRFEVSRPSISWEYPRIGEPTVTVTIPGTELAIAVAPTWEQARESIAENWRNQHIPLSSTITEHRDASTIELRDEVRDPPTDREGSRWLSVTEALAMIDEVIAEQGRAGQ